MLGKCSEHAPICKLKIEMLRISNFYEGFQTLVLQVISNYRNMRHPLQSSQKRGFSLDGPLWYPLVENILLSRIHLSRDDSTLCTLDQVNKFNVNIPMNNLKSWNKKNRSIRKKQFWYNLSKYKLFEIKWFQIFQTVMIIFRQDMDRTVYPTPFLSNKYLIM